MFFIWPITFISFLSCFKWFSYVNVFIKISTQNSNHYCWILSTKKKSSVLLCIFFISPPLIDVGCISILPDTQKTAVILLCTTDNCYCCCCCCSSSSYSSYSSPLFTRFRATWPMWRRWPFHATLPDPLAALTYSVNVFPDNFSVSSNIYTS